mmetsp:Transcript_38058/g.87931  ORF Transcript_38058/g.87931 Transcript_38058/m.87931 type:complete len:285 (+) Transcript_38058:393-1247(+)
MASARGRHHPSPREGRTNASHLSSRESSASGCSHPDCSTNRPESNKGAERSADTTNERRLKASAAEPTLIISFASGQSAHISAKARSKTSTPFLQKCHPSTPTSTLKNTKLGPAASATSAVTPASTATSAVTADVSVTAVTPAVSAVTSVAALPPLPLRLPLRPLPEPSAVSAVADVTALSNGIGEASWGRIRSSAPQDAAPLTRKARSLFAAGTHSASARLSLRAVAGGTRLVSNMARTTTSSLKSGTEPITKPGTEPGTPAAARLKRATVVSALSVSPCKTS